MMISWSNFLLNVKFTGQTDIISSANNNKTTPWFHCYPENEKYCSTVFIENGGIRDSAIGVCIEVRMAEPVPNHLYDE